MLPLKSPREGPSCLSQLLGAPAILGLQTHPSNLCLYLHAAFPPLCASMCESKLPSYYKDISHWIHGHPNPI